MNFFFTFIVLIKFFRFCSILFFFFLYFSLRISVFCSFFSLVFSYFSNVNPGTKFIRICFSHIYMKKSWMRRERELIHGTRGKFEREFRFEDEQRRRGCPNSGSSKSVQKCSRGSDILFALCRISRCKLEFQLIS